MNTPVSREDGVIQHHSWLDTIQVRLLHKLYPNFGGRGTQMDGRNYVGKSKVRVLLGDELVRSLAGKTVVDFGCGLGHEAIDLARSGAARVIGVDINEAYLEQARAHAAAAGVDVSFTTRPQELVDAIVSLDAFEHFADPAAILQTMAGLLKPGGFVAASFGPTWYHPLGGHVYSVFPWAHLLLKEAALVRWRAAYKPGSRVDSFRTSGLNQISIRQFERVVASSPFKIEWIECLPISHTKSIPGLHNRWTREFLTAIVRCRLRLE